MKNYIQPGDTLDYVNATGAAISGGDPVVVGNQIGVALGDIADTEAGVLQMTGVVELPKTTGQAIAQGSAPVLDASAGEVVPEGATPAEGDVSGALTAWQAADSAATTVLVKLNAAIGTVAPAA